MMPGEAFPFPDDAEWQARRFLGLFSADENTPLLWSTYDDKRKRDDLQFVLKAPFVIAEPRLRSVNASSAGVFVCIARMDGEERLDRHAREIRVLVLDLDGPPLPRDFARMGEPHAIISTSPGRWHCYWRVDSVPIGAFCLMQRKLAVSLGGDPAISVPSQRIRVAGFMHHKRSAYPVRIFHDDIDRRPCRFFDIVSALRSVDADIGNLNSTYWIRDRLSLLIVDHRLLSSMVWHEALKIDGSSLEELAERAWRQCEASADLAQLAPHCSQLLAYELARAAFCALHE